ncbi:uncharacterized protein ACRADG_010606 isoform 5-T6 [Cochliomyia hominivorax]
MFTSSFIMPNDLSDLCRVCLQLPEESQYLDLTTIYDEEDNLTYGECFFICTQIDLNDGEGVPHQLCKTCGLELQMSYDFHKKIEESKRVIAQCQKQIQEQKATYNANDLLVSGVESNKETSPLKEEENGITHLINNNKYIISEEEMELESGPSSSASHQEQQDVMQHINEQTYENTGEINEEATNEIDIVNKMNSNDLNVGKEDHKSSLEEVNFVTTEQEEHLEVDDYQNLEALEEEDFSHLMLDKSDVEVKEEEEDIVTITTITPFLPKGIRLPLPPGPPFTCEFCGHKARTKALFASHRHRKHRHRESPYECNICDKHFSSKDSYHKHLKRISCLQYPEFICEYCSKKIIGSANYKVHLRFHKKIYPFKCQLCDKNFMMANHLKTHIETKHENKRYMCEEANCDKYFQSQQSLKIHMYSHYGSLPYACEYCEKSFPNKGRLRWHIKRGHNIDISIEDLDHMLVAEEIKINAKVKPLIL